MRISWTLGLILALAGCGGDCLAPGGCDRNGAAGVTTGGATFNSSTGAQAVVYSVTGSATSATVSYRLAGGPAPQASVTLPWEYSFTAAEGDALELSAAADGTAGSVSVTVTAGGRVLGTNGAVGPGNVATVAVRCC